MEERILTVATDCSGIEAPLQALDKMGIKYRHIFSSDIDKKCQQFINRAFKPEKLWSDIKERDNKQYEGVPIDLYVAGFPCQAFSTLGFKMGFSDVDKGTIFYNVWDFIDHNRPTVFVLENVKGLVTHNKGETFKIIMDALHEFSEYSIQYKLLNAMDYGLPQSRNRVFIVGIKTDYMSAPFEWPTPISMPPIEDFLDLSLPSDLFTAKNRLRYQWLSEKFPQHNFEEELWVVFFGVNKPSWVYAGKQGICPTLVTTGEFVITNHQRWITMEERFKLQGMDFNKYDYGGLGKTALYRMSGNTMALNVLIAIFKQIFISLSPADEMEEWSIV